MEPFRARVQVELLTRGAGSRAAALAMVFNYSRIEPPRVSGYVHRITGAGSKIRIAVRNACTRAA
ncbi:hypothetical protein [Streptomyces sp. NPDC059092]|uniref:hypothetical protein n=1 Tax=Streptomyces sp. NPDC059092 TaxID=3346725 RepID=UPI0036BDD6B1